MRAGNSLPADALACRVHAARRSVASTETLPSPAAAVEPQNAAIFAVCQHAERTGRLEQPEARSRPRRASDRVDDFGSRHSAESRRPRLRALAASVRRVELLQIDPAALLLLDQFQPGFELLDPASQHRQQPLLGVLGLAAAGLRGSPIAGAGRANSSSGSLPRLAQAMRPSCAAEQRRKALRPSPRRSRRVGLRSASPCSAAFRSW